MCVSASQAGGQPAFARGGCGPQRSSGSGTMALPSGSLAGLYLGEILHLGGNLTRSGDIFGC